ncbi:hypothetical protein HNP33_003782 [Comamonas odontotermitis]|uniref:DUF7657 domain-containing protein n=1 Tax=Comamonas odontotermitis TaxID=379895 RepID=A0ABR6RKH2_9BURK|nr:hypothetical protein [Comamonas odontotermitis]MBB6579666.1 hypothetical protein [Comamonas odontotermitis]
MKKIQFKQIFLFLFLLTGIIYISNTWSPSSYAYFLKDHLGYEEIKPDFGQARPVRSDEWAVVTPMTQATVRNHFERYNKTSLYQEDLRINYGLPIADWGIIFKPTMWLYGLVNPAYAYSFHWFAIFSLFIGGYAFLFTKFGATNKIALLLSFGLYFTGFSQFWWNEKGPLIALFPWVIIPFFLKIKPIWQLSLFYYFAVSWLLTNLYPPVQISLAFVGFIVLLLLQPKLFKLPTFVYLLIFAGLAAGTAALYLYDYLKETSATVYPGGRHFSGGNVPSRFWLSWLFPGINFSWSYKDLIGMNMSEVGAVGMYYYISVLCLLNYKNFHTLWLEKENQKIFVGLTIAFFMQCAWMFLPVPANVGMILLWDNVQPLRMQFASGVILTFLVFYTANIVGIVFSWHRLLLLLIIATAGWGFFKYTIAPTRWEDLVFLPIIGLAYLAARNKPHRAHSAIIIASVIFGTLFFGRFNPLQSAWPIFNLEDNHVVKYLRNEEKVNDNLLVVTDLPGATANGFGFRSLSHVTPVPHMDFWKKSFPETSADELNYIFNRYSHINPYPSLRPSLRQADSLEVPINRFSKMKNAVAVQNYSSKLDKIGMFNIDKIYADAVVFNGWGGWQGEMKSRDIEIMVEPPSPHQIEWITTIRSDLPRNTANKISALNGFRLTLPRSDGTLPHCLSLISVDQKTGVRYLMDNPPTLPYCQSSIN